MSLSDRIRRSARRARDGRGGGLAGPVLARLGYGGATPGQAEPEPERARGPAPRRSDPWEERLADGHDDDQLAALRDELDTELDRLSRPRDDEAPGP